MVQPTIAFDKLVFDVLIAGGGAAGALAAARLSEAHPELKIALLEKEPALGGRLKVTAATGGQYSYGLNAASDQLFSFWNQTVKTMDPEALDLSTLVKDRQSNFGVLAGGRLVSNDIGLWFSAKGARTLGGLTAARQWGDVDEVMKQTQSDAEVLADDAEEEGAGDDGDTSGRVGATRKDRGAEYPFAHYWKKQRKSPAAIVLEHYAAAYGLPDLWSSSAQALLERAAYHSSHLHCGAWDEAFQALTQTAAFKERVTIVTDARIVNAEFAEQLWTVDSVAGSLQAKKLIVAQPPWQAMTWLPRSYWPPAVLQVASKTRPVSVVVLSERLLRHDIELPDVTIVPAERVQIINNNAGEVCFQATIDFELSLQAPAVLKSVRALKRARKKLLALYPDLVSEGDHIALHPVAWAQSPSQRDRRWLTRMMKKDFNTATLAFCGDAYGVSYDGDANLVKSLLAACMAVSQSL